MIRLSVTQRKVHAIKKKLGDFLRKNTLLSIG
ncbi:hypothetical protein [Caudoviricetes sp.]|nr:hypothetical protein [Caudoviricetes sp.]